MKRPTFSRLHAVSTSSIGTGLRASRDMQQRTRTAGFPLFLAARGHELISELHVSGASGFSLAVPAQQTQRSQTRSQQGEGGGKRRSCRK